MECMCAQTRPRFILASDRDSGGNGVRIDVNSKGKNPFYRKNPPQRRIEPTTIGHKNKRCIACLSCFCVISNKRCTESTYRVYISRVSDLNGLSLLYIMLEIHHSGWEPLNYDTGQRCRVCLSYLRIINVNVVQCVC